MTSTARFPKATAVAFALLMLAPVFPVAAAEHTADTVPDIFVLPHARATDECVGTGIPREVAAAMAAAQRQDGAYLAQDKGVPAICGPGANEFRQVVEEADRILQEFRNVTIEAQRQADARYENLYPEGDSPKPTVTLLADRFDGRRVGGIGDWQVLTEDGGAPEFRLDERADFNGTLSEWRFGDEEGYERGTREFLVSPEIDLRAVRGQQEAQRRIEYAKGEAIANLRMFCEPPTSMGNGIQVNGVTSSFCGTFFGAPGVPTITLDDVLGTFADAVEGVAESAPVGQPLVTFDAIYRHNFALTEDGARFWIYVGNQTPDRLTLFSETFGDQGYARTCSGIDQANETTAFGLGATNGLVAGNTLTPVYYSQNTQQGCTYSPDGGFLLPMEGLEKTLAFPSTSPDRRALTGTTGGPRQVTFDLSNFTGTRAWILLEVATTPDLRGSSDYFTTPNFPETKDFGFALQSVEVVGEAWPRNFRVHEFVEPAFVTFRDGEDSVRARIAVPPLGEPLVLPIHNAGAYVEHGNVTVSFVERKAGAATGEALPSVRLPVVNVRPHEVRMLSVPWPAPLLDGYEYDVSARLVVDEFQPGGVFGGATPEDAIDPTRTDVGFPNYASNPQAPALATTATVHSFVRRALEPVPLFPNAPDLVVCADALDEEGRCAQLYAAKKGLPRVLAASIRNDGNTMVDAVATLHLELDGEDKSSAILDGATRSLPDLLPTETRDLQWDLALNDPGVYRATVVYSIPGSTFPGVAVERFIFTQQTTGLVCYDDLDATRECGALFRVVEPREIEGVDFTSTAFGPEGVLFAATAMNQTDGALYVRFDDGTWAQAAGLSNASLVENLTGEPHPYTGFGTIRAIATSPSGTLYLAGDNGTLVSITLDGRMDAVPFADTAYTNASNVSLVSAAWWDDTLHVVGNGTLFALREGKLAEVNLTYTTLDDLNVKKVERRLRTIAANETHAFLGGLNGTIYVNSTATNATWRLLRTFDEQTDFRDPVRDTDGDLVFCRPAQQALGNCMRNVTGFALTPFGVGFAIGEDGLVLVTTNAANFTRVDGPNAKDLRLALATHLGTLFVLDADGGLFACEPCGSDALGWTRPEISLPYVSIDGAKEAPARILVGAAGDDLTVLLAQHGIVLEYDFRGEYDNFGDWSTQTPLVAEYGGVQTAAILVSGSGQQAGGIFRISPPLSAPSAPTSAVVRVVVRHYVSQLDLTKLYGEPPAGQTIPPPTIRLVPAAYPGGQAATAVRQSHTCPSSTDVSPCGPFVFGERAITRPTPYDTWETTTFDVALSSVSPRDLALEMFATSGIGLRWAIDSAEAYLLHPNGTAELLLSYHGPNAFTCSKERPTECNRGAAAESRFDGGRELINCSTQVCDTWNLIQAHEEVLDHDRVSAWHLSRSLADRPVWVANDEVYPGLEGGPTPHLRDNWNSRLVSPVLDLTDVYDPFLTFRHLFAFRMETSGTETISATYGDVGQVEIQYLRSGAECGATDPRVTCWSNFSRLEPVGGYPNATTLGLDEVSKAQAEQYQQPIGDLTNSTPPRAFWGRIASADEQGLIADVRDTDRYQEVAFHLNATQVIDERGQPVNLTGRYVRIGFHLMTWHNTEPAGTVMRAESPTSTYFSHLKKENIEFPRSYPLEGWYVTDFKVQGARHLGVDLEASNLSIPVGYEVDRIGVGPGERVPVNVTVTNHGVFEALGYVAALQVHRVVDPVLQKTEIVETLDLPQQPLLDAGASVNHTFHWDVPDVENETYLLAVAVEPIGLDRDEDPTDNVDALGSFGSPLLARTTREFHVEFLVTPENATTDITRYVPIYVNNTGNVPLSSIEVARDISILQGTRSGTIETRSWTTDVPVGAGSRAPLAALDEDFSPVDDLFWKAPERANFFFRVVADVPESGLRSVAERRVAAYATYLFDDVERGVVGESVDGVWLRPDGTDLNVDAAGEWNVQRPGFRSQEAYGVGDPVTGRLGSDAENALVSPVIDLSNARSADFAMFHRFLFEEGFDGGVVEASVDGGETWRPLTPSEDLANELIGHGYSRAELSAASRLHETGDPSKPTYGFTGDSAELPEDVEGWLLSQFDLTDYEGVTRSDVAYERLQVIDFTDDDVQRVAGTNRYRDPTWGSVAGDQDWSVANLTENRTRAIATTHNATGFWWSGSATYADDLLRPANNYYLTIPVDLTAVDTDAVVEIDWWEWADRTNMRSLTLSPAPNTFQAKDFMSAFEFTPDTASHTWRLNVSEPKIVETDGRWYHMVSTLPQSYLGKAFDVHFVYSPVGNPSETAPYKRVIDRYRDDPGFAIDGFTVRSYKLLNGIRTGEEVLLNETQAWDARSVRECVTPGTPDPKGINVPCVTPVTPPQLKPLTPAPAGADTWRVVDALPRLHTPWYVVDVLDEQGSDKLPTGENVSAFYSGDVTCPSVTTCGQLSECLGASNVCSAAQDAANCLRDMCVRPGTESRLVTPAVDMSIVAGDEAEFTFWHRYAFYKVNNRVHPLGSGGAVEVQEFDPETGEWGAWRQMYPDADAADPLATLTGSKRLTADGEGYRFGYSSYSADKIQTRGGSGIYRSDPPFEGIVDEKGDTYEYYYSGKSSDVPGAPANGWIRERYDVSDLIGKKVRFGFHFYLTGAHRAVQTSDSACFDVDPTAGVDCKAGWWIRDAAVVGDVLAGEELQIRLRAATDGNVDQGHWQVDDLGLFGSRYGHNVALFANETPGAYGAVNDSTVTIPITIRNLGSVVERGLAVEVRQPGNDSFPRLNFSGTGAAVSYEGISDAFGMRFTGIDLAAGDSTTVYLEVATPPEVPSRIEIPMLLTLVRFNEGAGKFVRVDDNEVQGFLESDFKFVLDNQGRRGVGDLAVTPASIDVGEPADLRVPLRNDGYTPITLDSYCYAQTISGYERRDHRREEEDKPIAVATYPCVLVEGDASATLAPGEATTLVFRAFPTRAGTLRFVVDQNVTDSASKRPLAMLVATAPIGESPVVLEHDFTERTVVSRANFSETRNARWSEERGFRERGALHFGNVDGMGPQNQGSSTPHYASIVVDLHNLTSGAYLSFWHLDRFGRGDGAQVRAQILQNEATPANAGAYTPDAGTTLQNSCLLVPEQGYDGPVLGYMPNPQDTGAAQADPNPAFMAPANSAVTPSDVRYPFFHGGPDDAWEFARFDLGQTGVAPAGCLEPLIGHTVKLTFAFFAGSPGGIVGRVPGEGWYIDDLTISPLDLELRPTTAQRTRLLDNTTKEYHVVLRNDGPVTDLVRLTYDGGNSSTPAGSVFVDPTPIELLPGEERIVPVLVTLPRDPSFLPTSYVAQLDATSVFDLNAGKRTLLNVDFAPREWAELSVSAEAPRFPVQEGTQSFIPVTIENNGLVPSVASTLRITDRWVQDGVVMEKVETPPIPSIASFFADAERSTEIFEYAWTPEAGSLGEHTLTFEVDPLVLGEEYTRTNNVVTVTAIVAKLLVPDLSVAAGDALTLRDAAGLVVVPQRDAEVARYQVTAGEIVSFDVKVRNLGAGGVTNVDVRTFIGALTLPPKTVPYIAPGGEVELTFNWLAQRGDYPVEVLVRQTPADCPAGSPADQCERPELSVDNNRHPARGVAILVVKDFEVTASAEAPAQIVEPGTDIPVAFTLTNTGNAGEELRLDTQLPPGWSARFARPEFFLRAGETFEGVATVSVPADAVAGEQFISILAISRENPMKVAAARTPVGVRAFYDGRAVPTFASVAPPTFVLPVDLVNDGNSLEPWTVDLRLPAGWTTAEPLPIKVVVPARGHVVHEIRVTVPAGTQPGIRDVPVLATMPDGTPVNSTATVELTARRGATVTLGQGDATGGEGALSYPVVVESVGNVKAPFRVLLLDPPAGLDARLEPAEFDLAPGQTAQARLVVAPGAEVPSGTYGLRTYALFEGVHPDSTEGRANLGSVAVRLDRPDLAVFAVEQTPRADVEEGDRVVLKVTVENRGESAAPALPVHLYADDLFIGEAMLPALAPGERGDALLNWTALAGDHTLTVVVDPYADTVDAVREDNAFSVQAQVAGSGTLGGVAAGRLDTPAPGLGGLLIALAAALALVALPLRPRRPLK